MKIKNKEMRKMFTRLILFFVAGLLTGLVNNHAVAQSYIYSTVTGSGTIPGNLVTGTGTWASPVNIPGYTFTSTSTGNRIHGFLNTLGGSGAAPEVASLTDPWEVKYGQIDPTTTNCIKLQIADDVGASDGSPLQAPIVTTINFNSVANPGNWGFMALDIDVDQCVVKAKDPFGNYYPQSVIASWFKGVMNMGTLTPSAIPCWDAATGTIVGSSFVNSPCAYRSTLTPTAVETEGASAWFEPNVPVSALEFTFYNLQSNDGSPSERYFIAAQTALNISGNVYNDLTGLTDNTVNGTGIGTPSSTQLWAYLLDATGHIIDSAKVSVTGTYALQVMPSALPVNYTIKISTNQYAPGTSPLIVPNLPSGWVSTGENLGTAAGSDGIVDATLSVTVSSTNVANANFGIQQPPTAVSNTLSPVANPGGTTSFSIPATYLDGIDYSGGTITNITITSFPSNATSITINGITYTSATFPLGGVAVPTDVNGNPTQTIAIDPVDGLVTSSFTYTATDNAGAISAPATITVPFTKIQPIAVNDNLSGLMVGATATINPLTNDLPYTGTTLTPTRVSLVASTITGATCTSTDAQGDCVSVSVPGQGTWTVNPTTGEISFTPQSGYNGDPSPIGYTVTDNLGNLSNIATVTFDYINPPTTACTNVVTNGTFTGSATGWTTSNGWAYNASGYEEQLGGALQATPAVLSQTVTGLASATQTLRFTLGARITGSYAYTGVLEVYLGGVKYATFSNSATSNDVAIVGSTSNGATFTTSYALNAGINTYNTTVVNLSIPYAGSSTATLSFNYYSSSATTGDDFYVDNVTLGGTCIDAYPISGTVYNDVNGSIGGVDGTGTNAGGLYANLLNSSGQVIATVSVAANGTYSFADIVPGTYSVQISSVQGVIGQAAPVQTLPSGWANTGDEIGATQGSTVNGLSETFTVTSPGITNVNFGIQQPPTAVNNTLPAVSNPGGTNNFTILPTYFDGNDVNGGVVTSITITSFPTNANSITINGTTYTSATFPPGGVAVPTDANGNPTQAIAIDPVDGLVTSIIHYTATDNAGAISAPATVTVPFTLIKPLANDDTLSGTPAGSTATINPLTNDVPYTGTTLDPTKVSLVESSITGATCTSTDAQGDCISVSVPGQGTWTVNPSTGEISFTPQSGYTSDPTPIDYTVADNLGNISNPATVTFDYYNPPTMACTNVVTNGTFTGSATGWTTSNGWAYSASGYEEQTGGALQATPAVLSQTVTGLAAATQTLSFTLGARITTSYAYTGVLEVYLGGVKYATFSNSATSNDVAIVGTTSNGATFATSYVLNAGVNVYNTTTVNLTIPYTGTSTAALTFSYYSSSATTGDDFYVDNVVLGGTCLAPTYSISGTVFNDVNAATAGVDGTGTNAGGLYANLLSSSGIVISTATIAADGTYSFNGIAAGTYDVQISTNRGVTGQAAPAQVLPSGWVNTGDEIGATQGATVNGVSELFTVTNANITDVNFGIQQPPTAVSVTLASQVNPAGTTNITIPSTYFDGNDQNGGVVTSITITSFPTNATSITINGGTYTSATFPVGGVLVPTDANGNPTQVIAIDPIDGTVTSVITYMATDNAGSVSAPATVTVPFTNDHPTANPDTATTNEDTPVTVPVLINDSFGGDGPSSGTITIITQPTYGITSVNDGGTPNNPADDMITYSPNANYNGMDTLVYQICDSNGDCDTAILVITVNPVNDVPVANPDAVTTNEDSPTTIPVTTNDSFGGDGPSTGTISIPDQPNHGTAVVNDGGTPNDPTDDQISYTPDPNYNGNDTLIYQICDINGDCDTALVVLTIQPVNDLPTANPDTASTKQGTPVTIPVLANDSFGGDGPSTGTITIYAAPGSGTATVNDGGTPNDPTDDKITYTPIPGFNGTDVFTYKICDSNGDCTTTTVTVTVAATPDLTPVIDLPFANFAAGETKNFVVYLEEVKGAATAPGVTAWRIAVPLGYKLETYDPVLTTITPSGGTAQTVSNSEFSLISQTTTTITLIAKPGVSISAYGVKYFGFKITRASAISQSVGNMTASIFSDATKQYDSYVPNNSYSRIINAK